LSTLHLDLWLFFHWTLAPHAGQRGLSLWLRLLLVLLTLLALWLLRRGLLRLWCRLLSLSLVSLVFPLLLQSSELLDLVLHGIVFLFHSILCSNQIRRDFLAGLLAFLYLRLNLFDVLRLLSLLGQHIKIAIFVLLHLGLGLGRPGRNGWRQHKRKVVDVFHDGRVDVWSACWAWLGWIWWLLLPLRRLISSNAFGCAVQRWRFLLD
jgi:hypothetical protein